MLRASDHQALGAALFRKPFSAYFAGGFGKPFVQVERVRAWHAPEMSWILRYAFCCMLFSGIIDTVKESVQRRSNADGHRIARDFERRILVASLLAVSLITLL